MAPIINNLTPATSIVNSEYINMLSSASSSASSSSSSSSSASASAYSNIPPPDLSLSTSTATTATAPSTPAAPYSLNDSIAAISVDVVSSSIRRGINLSKSWYSSTTKSILSSSSSLLSPPSSSSLSSSSPSVSSPSSFLDYTDGNANASIIHSPTIADITNNSPAQSSENSDDTSTITKITLLLVATAVVLIVSYKFVIRLFLGYADRKDEVIPDDLSDDEDSAVVKRDPERNFEF